MGDSRSWAILPRLDEERRASIEDMTSLATRLDGPILMLRQFGVDDAAALQSLVIANLEHLRPWMPWVEAHEPMSLDDRRALITGWQETEDAAYGIHLDKQLIGVCGAHRRVGPGGIELGYWLDAAHTGHGHVTDAVAMVTSEALSRPDIDRVEIHHDAANTPSRGIPERLGFRLVSELPDEIAAPGESGIELIWRTTPATWTAPARSESTARHP